MCGYRTKVPSEVGTELIYVHCLDELLSELYLKVRIVEELYELFRRSRLYAGI
jgi:hypothetical protein